MGNFLVDNQKNEIRFVEGDIVLYEPNDEQLSRLKEMVKEIDTSDESKATEISINYLRYIIRNLCKDGDFIDDISDEEFIQLWENGNLKIMKLKNAIEDLLSEVGELIMLEQSSLIKVYTQMANVLNSNNEIETMKTKFNKLFKKYNLTFDDVVSGNITTEQIEKMSKPKKTNKRKSK